MIFSQHPAPRIHFCCVSANAPLQNSRAPKSIFYKMLLTGSISVASAQSHAATSTPRAPVGARASRLAPTFLSALRAVGILNIGRRIHFCCVGVIAALRPASPHRIRVRCPAQINVDIDSSLCRPRPFSGSISVAISQSRNRDRDPSACWALALSLLQTKTAEYRGIGEEGGTTTATQGPYAFGLAAIVSSHMATSLARFDSVVFSPSAIAPTTASCLDSPHTHHLAPEWPQVHGSFTGRISIATSSSPIRSDFSPTSTCPVLTDVSLTGPAEQLSIISGGICDFRVSQAHTVSNIAALTPSHARVLVSIFRTIRKARAYPFGDLRLPILYRLIFPHLPRRHWHCEWMRSIMSARRSVPTVVATPSPEGFIDVLSI
ncbi:hypothetical protein DFP72DRAFT_855735 [Ephemerocybe angulata]|uniref:Uncharacterized protein n=1 Tax=Ephemerocybe angulata TaxID=980116 RepID=A0A8H6HGZ0_9AGAR|nr:hypothetical protein DFP72DRAFT_855735 [Tulosesus angulatus]